MKSMEKHEAIVYRVTDDTYLTETLFNREYRMLGSAAIWQSVLSYRKEYQVAFKPLQTLNKFDFFYTGTDAILKKINIFENFLRHYIECFDYQGGKKLEKVIQAGLLPCLAGINELESCEMSTLTLKAVLNHTYRNNETFHEPVLHYHSFLLEQYHRDDSSLPNDDFLGEALSALEGTEELTSFYRLKDFSPNLSKVWKVQTNPDYAYCPYERIESSVNSLWDALTTNLNIPITIRTLATLFYLDWIQPFDEYNSSIAVLAAKRVLAGELGPGAYLIPLEAFLVELHKPEFDFLLKEVRRSGDLTYLLDAFMVKMRSCFADFENIEKTIEKEIREDERAELYHQDEVKVEDEPVEEISEIPEVQEEVSLSEKSEVEEAPTISVKVEAKKEPSKTIIFPSPQLAQENENPVLSSFALSKMSEKEAKEYAQYLLETDPNLSRKQANFLATHLIPGRFYTIQQFKRFARCSYETARTSMDKLAASGYYTKSQIKNKFIYTPVVKGK